MDLQQGLVAGLVAICAARLAHLLWRQWTTRDGACGGCSGGCGSPVPRERPAPEARPLIALERRPRREQP
jgi:hypothetical protein